MQRLRNTPGGDVALNGRALFPTQPGVENDLPRYFDLFVIKIECDEGGLPVLLFSYVLLVIKRLLKRNMLL